MLRLTVFRKYGMFTFTFLLNSTKHWLSYAWYYNLLFAITHIIHREHNEERKKKSEATRVHRTKCECAVLTVWQVLNSLIILKQKRQQNRQTDSNNSFMLAKKISFFRYVLLSWVASLFSVRTLSCFRRFFFSRNECAKQQSERTFA